MSHTVEVSDEETIRPPADVPEQIRPHSQFSVKVHDGTVILRSGGQKKPLWATATPEEWVRAFRRWDTSRKGVQAYAEAVSRESIYE